MKLHQKTKIATENILTTALQNCSSSRITPRYAERNGDMLCPKTEPSRRGDAARWQSSN